MKILKTLALALVVVPAMATAQGEVRVGSGGWGPDSPYSKLYDKSTVVTFNGKVTGRVDVAAKQPGDVEGVALLIKATNGGIANVQLGPIWYMENQKQDIDIGDRLRITGSKVFVNGKSMILAQKVVKKNQVMYLREMSGFPMWVAFRGHVTVASNRPATTPALQTINGNIVQVIRLDRGQDEVASTAIVVSANGQLYTVDLGPEWFINRQDTRLAVGDDVVVGYQDYYRAPGPGNIYIANNVARGSELLILRYENGRPVWRIWG